VLNKPSGFALLKEGMAGILLSFLTGIFCYWLTVIINSPVLDPLLVAMVAGIFLRTLLGERNKLKTGFSIAPGIFIPVGIVFYGMKNLNFTDFLKVKPAMIILLIIIILVYFAVIIILGKILNQKKQITYLTATGSAICGASAIAITSPAVEADADDISVSLSSVAIAAFVGLSIFLPFFAILFNINNEIYGLLAGSVMQFTGLVKVAVKNSSFLIPVLSEKELIGLGLSVKAVRYLGLLIAIPLFASLIRKKLYIPWFLWAFLGAGLFGTYICITNGNFYNSSRAFIEQVYNIFWSVAMAATGLNANINLLLSNNGTKAIIMAFCGFFAAVITFFIGFCVINFI